MSKKFILNADDFGLSIYHNQAILSGYKNGILTSASLCVNTEGFTDAINNILPECKNLTIGLHLNIMEGKSLTECPLLTNSKGFFDKSYIYLIRNQKKQEFLLQVEKEFRAQIEKAINSDIKITHLDSHVHTHAIPELFKITCKLAKEYQIPWVRTQKENLYFVFPKCLSYKFFINIIKIILLRIFTIQNINTLKLYGLKTNDNTLGIGYTGMMSNKTILQGLLKANEGITEGIIHPAVYPDLKSNSHSLEFDITQNLKLKEALTKQNIQLVNFSL